MKKLVLLLAAFALIGCGDKEDAGRDGKTVRDAVSEQPKAPDERLTAFVDVATADLASTDVEALPLLPEVVT